MRKPRLGALLAGIVFLAGCSGGSNTTSSVGTAPPANPPPVSSDSGCTGSCADATSLLAPTDIDLVIARAVNEAQAQGTPATIAVVDRVGNVLAVYRMAGARPTVTITSNRGVTGGLENLAVPSELAAIAKAITGAYLSSEGNAFSTRTASQIVQEHFNPGEINAAGRPAVRRAVLPAAVLRPLDALRRAAPVPGRTARRSACRPIPAASRCTRTACRSAASAWSPTRLTASMRTSAIATAIPTRTSRWPAPSASARRSTGAATRSRSTARRSGLRDVEFSDLARDPASAPAYASLGAAAGGLIAVPGYYAGTAILAGTAFGQPASGIRPATTDYRRPRCIRARRWRRHQPLSAARRHRWRECAERRRGAQRGRARRSKIANRARAQIRRPLGTPAQRVDRRRRHATASCSASCARRDAPVFGIDVALQKARTAMFIPARTRPAISLMRRPRCAYAGRERGYLPTVGATSVAFTTIAVSPFADYLSRLRAFLGLPTALGDGAIAFTDRAGGNLSRPFYPDGVSGAPPGPLQPSVRSVESVPGPACSSISSTTRSRCTWRSTCSRSASRYRSTARRCPRSATCRRTAPASHACRTASRSFPGSVPIYRGNTLVGGIGVSGDGVDQDDMVAFLGLSQRRRRARHGIAQRAAGDARRSARAAAARACATCNARKRRSSTSTDAKRLRGQVTCAVTSRS